MRKGWFVGSSGNHFHDWGGSRYCVKPAARHHHYVITRNGELEQIDLPSLDAALDRAEQISGYSGRKVED